MATLGTYTLPAGATTTVPVAPETVSVARAEVIPEPAGR